MRRYFFSTQSLMLAHQHPAFKQLDINALNGKGITALQVACSKDAYDCAKVLLANGVWLLHLVDIIFI